VGVPPPPLLPSFFSPFSHRRPLFFSSPLLDRRKGGGNDGKVAFDTSGSCEFLFSLSPLPLFSSLFFFLVHPLLSVVFRDHKVGLDTIGHLIVFPLSRFLLYLYIFLPSPTPTFLYLFSSVVVCLSPWQRELASRPA